MSFSMPGGERISASAARPSSSTQRGAAVTLSGLTKRYDDVLALDDVSLTLQPGRFLVLLGPSGSGKSTLIRCLAGIERPTSGTISLGGQLIADGRHHLAPERRDLAMVFQDFALWPHMTALENVRFALRRRRLGKSESTTRALAMLDRVGLAVKRERYPYELSGGEQQRVALARALVGGPRLLLFDEPLSSLDASLRERLRIEIGTLVRESGASAVYITHDQSEAFALGDEVGVLQAGRLVQRDAPEAIYRTPAAPFVARFTGLAGSFSGRLIGGGEPIRAVQAEPEASLVGEHHLRGDRDDRAAAPAGLGGDSAAAAPAAPRRRRVRVAVPTSDLGTHLELEATATTDIPQGAAVQVLVRPTGVRMCDSGDARATLLATARDVAYCGRGYECVLQIAPGIELSSVFHSDRVQRGHRCGVALDPEGCLVFADDAARPSGDPLPVGALLRAGGTPRAPLQERPTPTARASR